MKWALFHIRKTEDLKHVYKSVSYSSNCQLVLKWNFIRLIYARSNIWKFDRDTNMSQFFFYDILLFSFSFLKNYSVQISRLKSLCKIETFIITLILTWSLFNSKLNFNSLKHAPSPNCNNERQLNYYNCTCDRTNEEWIL